MEALVLQQEIAEELERERKRNQKEISGLQHTNSTLSRQRDDAQRVVLHLRSLINGKTHHMEHVVRSINTQDLVQHIEEGYEDAPEPATSKSNDDAAETKTVKEIAKPKELSKSKSRSRVGSSSRATPVEEEGQSEAEYQLLTREQKKRYSDLSMSDVADRYLRDKTDAIADIIRNISEQCAAAVEGLQLAQDADSDENKQGQGSRLSASDDTHSGVDGSEMGENDGRLLTPDGRTSTIPPTPDLVHNRSSTSMSMASSTTTPERSSQQYGPGDIPTKIVEDDDEHAYDTEQETEPSTLSKQPSSQTIVRPTTTQVVS